MKITLYLMTQKGYTVLKALIENDFQKIISAIIIGRDKNIDNDFSFEIIALCNEKKITFFERTDNYTVLTPYSIAISWRWIINNPKSRLIIFHDSLLPKYRGFAPLVNSLINQEEKIGVSAIFASDEYDTGEIIAQSSTKIIYPIKIANAIDLITKNYIELAINLFSLIDKGLNITSYKQDEKLASYSLWRNENDYLINWNKSSTKILNFINAVSFPYKCASTYLNGDQKIRIVDVEIFADVKIENRDIGKLIFFNNSFPVIVCKLGLLKITKAYDDKTGESVLPFKKFRVKLTDYKI